MGWHISLETRHLLQICRAYVTEEQLEEALEQVWRFHLEPVLKEYLRGRRAADIDRIVAELKNSYGTSSPDVE